VRCTVSTDDPLVFANTVPMEYEVLAKETGFTRAELARVARNGWEVADVPREVRDRAIAEIAAIAAPNLPE
jgi:adenosine deaminase